MATHDLRNSSSNQRTPAHRSASRTRHDWLHLHRDRDLTRGAVAADVGGAKRFTLPDRANRGAYAFGSLVAAIPLTLLTQTWSRRSVLLLTVIGFLIFNSVTALSNSYWLTLAARFMAGASAGLAWSLLAGYARRMVLPEQQGRAMAIAMVGTPIALSIGVPLGTWLGTTVGWRMAFAVMSGLSILLVAWILMVVPDYPGQKADNRIRLGRVIAMPGVRSVLAVVLLWMLGHNILYTYIAPFVERAGIGNRVDLILLTFGIASLLGIWISGQMVDRALRRTVVISLAGFAVTALGLGLVGQDPRAVIAGTAIWGLTFGGAATLLQTALADTAGDGSDVALSMNVVVWNAAIALGSIIGGVLLDTGGAGTFPWAVLLLSGAGLLVAVKAKGAGFRPGRRSN